MAAKKILITYEIWGPDDLEAGDTDQRGWIDEDGESMRPDKWDREEGLTAVDKAVSWLEHHGATEGSEGGAKAASRWWTNFEHDTDYGTGEVEQRSYHLEGFTETERREIQRRMERRS